MRYGIVQVAVCAFLLTAWPVYALATVLHVPGDYATIQAAVNAASVNDTIQVAAGTFNERVTIQTDLSGVTLTGNADAFGASAGGPGITTITGGILFNYASTITGFTIQNLYVRRNAGTYGTGPIIRAGSSQGPVDNFRLENCVLDGQAQDAIGGFYSDNGRFGGDVVFNHIECRDIAYWYLVDTASALTTSLPVGSYTFTNNWIHNCNGSVALRGNLDDHTDLLEVSGNTWSDIGGNFSEQGLQWAAIEINNAASVQFHDNTISGVQQGEGSEGQAIQIWNTDAAEIRCNTFSNNYQGLLFLGTYLGPPNDNAVLVVKLNNFLGNSQYGISNIGVPPVNARYNWWGAANGPSGVGPGSGDAVSANVSFNPWLTTPVGKATVNVQLEGITPAPHARTIHLTFSSVSDPAAKLEIDPAITYTAGVGQVTTCAPFGYVTAKDAQHALSRYAYLTDLGGGLSSASFTGSGKPLGGDLNNDNVCDIWDYGILAVQYGGPPPPVGFNADIDLNGTVGKPDLMMLYSHYLTRGSVPLGQAVPTPSSRITLAQLAAIVGGTTNARKADLDRNNIIDTTDLRIFYMRQIYVR